MTKEKEHTPKFKVGDKVTYGGQQCEVITVGQHDEHWLAGHPQLYGVRLPGWTKTPAGTSFVYTCPDGTGAVRDHEFETVGCVPESELTASKGKH